MVEGNRLGDLAATFKIGTHEVVSGVPPTLGGKDEGPTPHQLLEAALAACTIITVQMYANRKQIPVTNTHVVVRTDSETKEASHLTREIRFDGDLSTEQRQRLLDIANKCPVHNLLESKITIETKLV